MLALVKEKFETMDIKIKKLMKRGTAVSILILLLSCLVLFTYDLFYASPDLYYIGLSIFKMGSIFIAGFISCGFVFNEVKKDFGV